MKKIFKPFETLNWKTVAVTVPVTLAYPIIRSLVAKTNKLTMFSNSLLIISLVLMLIGICMSFVKKGDFDITRYLAKRTFEKHPKTFSEYKKDREAERSQLFNYPLFFGIIYLVIATIVAYLC